MHNLLTTVVAGLAAITLGCAEKGANAPTTPAAVSAQAKAEGPPIAPPSKAAADMSALPRIDDATPYSGPEVSVSVTQLESFPVQHAASVEMNTPTGGWKLTRDHAAVIDGVARLFYTLEKPAADEWTTLAIVILRDRFASTDPAFEHAEVYVHSAQRGVSTLTTNYRLAARE